MSDLKSSPVSSAKDPVEDSASKPPDTGRSESSPGLSQHEVVDDPLIIPTRSAVDPRVHRDSRSSIADGAKQGGPEIKSSRILTVLGYVIGIPTLLYSGIVGFTRTTTISADGVTTETPGLGTALVLLCVAAVLVLWGRYLARKGK